MEVDLVFPKQGGVLPFSEIWRLSEISCYPVLRTLAHVVMVAVRSNCKRLLTNLGHDEFVLILILSQVYGHGKIHEATAYRMLLRTSMTDTNHANGTTPNGIVTNGVHAPDQLDVLVIGAGFSGCYLLHKLRALGYKTRVVESGGGIGGVWHWSTYPGARVDSPYPYYALSIPEVWKDWEYTEMYPGWQELRRYFEHVGKTLDLNKDMVFNTTVTAANFDENTNTWTVSCSDGKQYKTRFLVAGVGFAAKKHIPDWEGLDRCKATIVHSSYWPDDLDIKGKKLAVVGNGATGVQIIQECANEVEELTAFVRTPNLCLPMQQKRLSSEGQQKDKATLQQVYSHRLTTFGGLSFSPLPRPHTADTPEQREKLYEDLWQQASWNLKSCLTHETLCINMTFRVASR